MKMPRETANSQRFWHGLDRLVSQSTVIVDRPAGSKHPRHPEFIYPLDYGYLEGTAAVDQGGVDIWAGSQEKISVTGVIATVDLRKKDAEIKILLSCTPDEMRTIEAIHNAESQSGILILRNPSAQ
jgi:inorganic pyrophosphatase